MTQESFSKAMLRYLTEQLQRYPAMQQQDIVKFVFQAMLGAGHLVSSRDAVTKYAAREMALLPADPGETLYEMLSPSWCRLNLRAAKARAFTPSVIAGLMSSSGKTVPFTRQDVYTFCEKFSAQKHLIRDPALLNRILDETWLPSHSAAYREQYRPAYRVIPAEWISRMEVLQRISEQKAARVLVTMDGPCATGKTTLAGKLADIFEAAVVHTDDYVIPHAQKTAERLAVPGGNCDAGRLVREVAAPWKQGKSVLYRKYDFRNDRLLPEEKLPDCRILILEGSYCSLPALRQYADVRIFVTASWETRLNRLRKRESPRSLQMFFDRWIPLEDRYFEAFRLPDSDCAVLNEGESDLVSISAVSVVH